MDQNKSTQHRHKYLNFLKFNYLKNIIRTDYISLKKKYLSEFEQFLYKFFANNFYINKFILNKTPYRYLQCIEQSTINSSFN